LLRIGGPNVENKGFLSLALPMLAIWGIVPDAPSSKINCRIRAKVGQAISKSEVSVSKPSRDDILTAALNCFATNGFDGTSLACVARTAGVSHPLIHYHFKNKDVLWRATVEMAFGSLIASFETIKFAADDLEPLDALRLSIKAFARFCGQYPQHIDFMMAEGRNHTERFEWVIQTYLAPLHLLSNSIITKATAQGLIRDVPIEHLTNLIIGTTAHFVSARGIIKSIYGVDTLDPNMVSAHADWVCDIVFNGITITPPST
jgi:TetR/AcrR family transcriptional regulator